MGFLNIYSGYSQIVPAKIFSNNMVLQRNKPILVWGKAKPNEYIEIQLGEIVSKSNVNKKGDWKIELPAHKVSRDLQMVIRGENDSVIFKNVLIGDVWLASGQSNMEHPVQGWEWIPNSAIDNYTEELQDADYTEIRLFNVPKFPSPLPVNDLTKGTWKIADSSTVAPFSSTAWFFAKKLHQELDIPIGVIHSSWGGTPIKSWMSYQSLVQFKDSQWIPEKPDAFNVMDWENKLKNSLDSNRIRRNQISYPAQMLIQKITANNYDDSKWQKVDMANKKTKFDNVVWLRKRIVIPQKISDQQLAISLGFLNRQSHIYFNGQKVGYFQYPEPVKFNVPPYLVKEQTNMISIRLAHPGKQTTIYGNQHQFFISTLDNRFHIPISQDWLFHDSLESITPKPRSYQHYPTYLFNGMIAPVIPYGIKGFLWYQGESDAGRPLLYEKMFQSLILDWRKKWDDNELPFLFFQLSKTKFSHLKNEPDKWEKIRKSQKKALNLPETFMVKTIDLGDPYDIHPHNKKDFGWRMAKLALKKIYR